MNRFRTFAAMLIPMAISRAREYIADEDGARIAGNPRDLSDALRKLHNAEQQIPMATTPATAHMTLVDIYKISIAISLSVVAGILLVSMLASLVWPRQSKNQLVAVAKENA